MGQGTMGIVALARALRADQNRLRRVHFYLRTGSYYTQRVIKRERICRAVGHSSTGVSKYFFQSTCGKRVRLSVYPLGHENTIPLGNGGGERVDVPVAVMFVTLYEAKRREDASFKRKKGAKR